MQIYLPTIPEFQVQSLEDPLEKEMQSTPVFLPREFHEQRGWCTTVHGVMKSQTWLSDKHYTITENSITLYSKYVSVKINPLLHNSLDTHTHSSPLTLLWYSYNFDYIDIQLMYCYGQANDTCMWTIQCSIHFFYFQAHIFILCIFSPLNYVIIWVCFHSKKIYIWPILKYQSPILQIAFSVFSKYPNYYQFDLLVNVCVCMLSCFSCVQLFMNLWTVGCQASLSVGLSRPEYWSGLPCLPQGIFPTQG